jgi:hypothetical protein
VGAPESGACVEGLRRRVVGVDLEVEAARAEPACSPASGRSSHAAQAATQLGSGCSESATAPGFVRSTTVRSALPSPSGRAEFERRRVSEGVWRSSQPSTRSVSAAGRARAASSSASSLAAREL